MTRLTNQQLRELRDQGDWRTLWEHAALWVKYAARLLRTDEREDLIQDGMLAVGLSIQRWEPDRGEFSTFVKTVARSAMLAHIQKKNKRRDSSVDLDGEMTLDSGDVVSVPPSYSDTDHTPMGYGDPAIEIGRQLAQESAEQLLRKLNAEESMALREYLGLPILEDEGEVSAVKDLAAARGIPRPTFSRDVLESQRFLNARQRTHYMSITSSVLPSTGREPRKTHRRAETLHPGFWHGLAGAMGDTDAWRESVGAVWKDWSWKPTDNDILSGAKP